MHREARIIKVPGMKYARAVQYKEMMRRTHGLNIPIWKCLSEIDKQDSFDDQHKQFRKMFRRML
jgi:hypothetical protein